MEAKTLQNNKSRTAFLMAVAAVMVALIVIGVAVLVLYSVVWGFKEQNKELRALQDNKLTDK